VSENIVDPQPNAVYWSSPRACLIVASAAAIGLGNVWRLPGIAEAYGGAAFLIVYALALLLMGIPVLVAELVLGRRVRGSVVSSIGRWVSASGQNRLWKAMGYMALAGSAIVLSYYSVIAGWSVAYTIRAGAGVLEGLERSGLREQFINLAGDAEKGLGWHAIFLCCTTFVVAMGVREGLEPAGKVLLTGAFVIVGLLLAAAAADGDLPGAVAHFTRVDFAALGWRGAIEAIYQAFFSLSLGFGVMVAFGAYLQRETSLFGMAMGITVVDTLFTVLVGTAMTALLLAGDFPLNSGLQLVFEVLPTALNDSLGGWASTLFFLMLILITLSTAVALMELMVVWVIERWGLSRLAAAMVCAVSVWGLGLGTLLSFNLLADWTWLGRTMFDWLALVSGRVILPLVGLLICVFMGRFLPAEAIIGGWIGSTDDLRFRVWRFLLRYPARIGLILVILNSVGVFEFADWLWGSARAG